MTDVSSPVQCCFCCIGIARVADDPVGITVAPAMGTGASQELWAHALCLHRVVHPSVPLLPVLPDDLDALPRELALQSASPNEIVLPFEAAIEAIDRLDAAHYRLLGWEGWIRTAEGHVGHGDAPPGTGDLTTFSPREASRISQDTIREANTRWSGSRMHPGAELLFCITVAAV